MIDAVHTVIDGDPNWGKSFFMIELIARTTTGRDWPDGAHAIARANVILLSAEDSEDTVIVPRLIAAEANLARVRLLTGSGKAGGVTVPEGLAKLRDMIALDGAKLVIVDPIVAFVDHSVGVRTVRYSFPV